MFCDECGAETGNGRYLTNVLGLGGYICQDCLDSNYVKIDEDTFEKKINIETKNI
jgi:hypothetical protein